MPSPKPKDTSKNADDKSPVLTNNSPPPSAANATKTDDAAKTEVTTTTKTEPLAPPPRPDTTAITGQTPDYFQSSHLSTEANPFEFSFGGGSSAANGNGIETPGGTKLPSVAALTSPANLAQSSNFWGGLRSGPLSPAMLSGPQRSGEDYFTEAHHHLRASFTPNESSLRSGLTPGGGGSMFPDVSPSGSINGLASFLGGSATPNTIDFHRTAMKAASAIQRDAAPNSQNITSQPQETLSTDTKPTMPSGFDQHDANDAANGLYLLANQSQQARGAQPPPSMYTVAPQANGMMAHSHPQMMTLGGMPQSGSSPNMGNRNHGSISTNSARGMSEMSGGSEENDSSGRPNTRNKGKRSSTQISQGNGRGSNDTPSKAPAGKKKKGNSAAAMAMEPEPESEEEPDMSKDGYHANGKKMTDEEKRKNFLERNRVAALKCRQRKKQWLQNLQQKVEVYSTENDALTQQISSLRDEILNLRTLLAAHKDCPVSHQQGIQGHLQHQDMMNGYGAQNPYGMAAALNQQQQQQQQLMAGQTRRYS